MALDDLSTIVKKQNFVKPIFKFKIKKNCEPELHTTDLFETILNVSLFLKKIETSLYSNLRTLFSTSLQLFE